jgi:ABC-type phosphate/phosphonate transport system substrate-binding protein
VTFAHLRRLYPALADQVRVLCWTPLSPSLPFVTARSTSEETLNALRAALTAVVKAPALRAVRERLFLENVDLNPDVSLTRVRDLERDALRHRYPTVR